MRNLTLGSLFDGSGGFPLAGLLSGITPVWASEIEPFPIRVTTKRLPFMKHYGDISQMDGGKVEPVDIICFGSPCTDMSVAGKRAGLDGQQSVLFYQAVRIIKEMRKATNGKFPRWICWENVPGAFSSNAGRDFQAVLEAIIRIAEPEAPSVPMPEKGGWPTADCYMGDRWSVAYRVLDAQYWGVAQRRKRIFLIGDLTGKCAGDVLFKSEGVSGYSPQSLRSWQRTAGGFESGIGAPVFGLDGYNGAIGDTAATLGVNCGMSTGRNGVVLNDQGGTRMEVTHGVTHTLRAEARHPPVVMEPNTVPIDNHPADSRVDIAEDGNVQTLTSRMGTGGGNVPLVMKIRCGCEGGGKGPLIQTDKSATLSCNNDQTLFAPKVYGICAKDSNAMKSPNPYSGFYVAQTTRTLDANGGNPTCNQGGMAVVCVDQGGGKSSCSISEGLAPTLACTHGGEPVVCVKGETVVIEGNGTRPSHKGDGFKEADVMYTLNTVDRHAVTAPTYSSSKASFFTQAEEDLANTLVATDYKDPPIINTTPCGFDPSTSRDVGQYVLEDCGNTLLNGTCPGYHNGVVDTTYTVRRLTPTECSRLQGFPDWWCSDLGTAEPTDEEVSYWTEVWETHRRIVAPGTKAKSEKQIRKWIAAPHSDAAEYKMWGNGVALPCVYFVLAGVAYYAQLSEPSE